MLSAVNRLTDSDGFRRAVRSGRRSGCSTVVVHLWTDPDAAPGPVRVGFTVSKAVGNAATRNRVKRRLRHLTREHLPALEELPGRAVLVVRALPAAAQAPYAALGTDLARTLGRVSAT
ncbi:ribonuclease P protein component [Nocardioides xinjiangensis]|uniref:ribonuclease P protein component n=1 Tax=Nocardioides xinjiangensis TaxID=2817376 RepID=UPI001B317635|nr:ribonuclease P protein component [Nocardioides sp. SYSU D00778]